MPRVQLFILANSYKRSDRCLAGRALLPEGGRYRLGDWIRPVSGHGEGELAAHERRYGDGSDVQVLDAVEVDLTERVYT